MIHAGLASRFGTHSSRVLFCTVAEPIQRACSLGNKIVAMIPEEPNTENPCKGISGNGPQGLASFPHCPSTGNSAQIPPNALKSVFQGGVGHFESQQLTDTRTP